jgi:hypothetical protein
VLVACCLGSLSPVAQAASSDQATTLAYLRTEREYYRSALSHVRQSRLDVESFVKRTSTICGGERFKATPGRRGDTEMIVGVFYAVGLAAEDPNSAASTRVDHEMKRLRWSDKTLTRLVHSLAAIEERYALHGRPPAICADLRAWARSDYKTVPRDIRNLLKLIAIAERDTREIRGDLNHFDTGAVPAFMRRVSEARKLLKRETNFVYAATTRLDHALFKGAGWA